jgi:hypothetical protein
MTTLMVPNGVKIPKKSDDYVNEIMLRAQNRTASHEQKQAAIARVLADEVSGFKRLGVGMIGPIQLKLRYQGITRNVLVEDPVTPGTPIEYDVWDDLGQAYLMSGHDGASRSSRASASGSTSSASARSRSSARKTSCTSASTRWSRPRTRRSRRSSSRRTPA